MLIVLQMQNPSVPASAGGDDAVSEQRKAQLTHGARRAECQGKEEHLARGVRVGDGSGARVP